MSDTDRWVKRGSGVGNLPESLFRRVSVSHSELVKPSSEADAVFSYFADQIERMERRRRASIVGISGTTISANDVRSLASLQRLGDALSGARYVISAGEAAGVERGDVFVVILERRPFTDSSGKVIDFIRQTKAVLEVAEVREHASHCKLQRLEATPDSELETIVPREGDEVEKVPGETWQRVHRMDEGHAKATDSRSSPDKRREATVDLLSECQDFLETYTNSFFAEQARQRKGWAQMQLGRHDEAIRTFSQFDRQYPFSASTKRVQDWAKESTLRKRLVENSNDTEALCGLGSHLVGVGRGSEEGVDLIRRALAIDSATVDRALDSEVRAWVATRMLEGSLGLSNEELESLLSQAKHDDSARKRLSGLLERADTLSDSDRDFILASLSMN